MDASPGVGNQKELFYLKSVKFQRQRTSRNFNIVAKQSFIQCHLAILELLSKLVNGCDFSLAVGANEKASEGAELTIPEAASVAGACLSTLMGELNVKGL